MMKSDASIQSDNQTNPEYRRDIDGLRAIAVLSVIGFHAFPQLVPGGFIGVDIFFVISGFLISSIILKKIEKDAFRFTVFFARRIKRIFPALIIVLLTAIILGWFFLFPIEIQQLGKYIAASAGFVSNFALWGENNYFDESTENKPLAHLWSLGIEEQFYIIWPLIIWLTWKKRFGFAFFTTLIGVSSFILNIILLRYDATAAFYSPLARMWELMLGGILAYIMLYAPRVVARNSNYQSLAGIAMVALSLFLIERYMAFPGWLALIPTVGAFLLLSAGPRAWFNRRVLCTSGLVWIGLISYPLYLWHWMLLSFAQIVTFGTPSREVKIVLILLSFLLAAGTYYFVEKRIRFGNNNYATTTLIFFMLFSLVVGIFLWQGIIKPRNNIEHSEYLNDALKIWDYEASGFSTLFFENKKFFKKGTLEKTVLFLGDSHVQHYAPRINSILTKHPEDYKSALFATMGGCPPIPHVYMSSKVGCQAYYNAALKIAKGNNVDTIVLGACWMCYFILGAREQAYYQIDEKRKEFLKDEGAPLALKELESFIKLLAQEKTVFFLLDNPRSRSLDPKYYFRSGRLPGKKGVPPLYAVNIEEESDVGRLRKSFAAIAKNAGAIVIDPYQYVCYDGACPAFTKDSIPLYRDGEHFSSFYAEHFIQFIDQTIALTPNH